MKHTSEPTALDEALQDLQDEVTHRWVHMGSVHPANQRKYDRDMAIVTAAREELAKLRADSAALVERVWAALVESCGVIEHDEYWKLLPSPYIANVEKDDLRQAIDAAILAAGMQEPE